MHAVYALCRLADDIVDDAGRAAARHAAAGAAPSWRPSATASARPWRTRRPATTRCWPPWRTASRTCGIDPECFDRFFDAMAQDLDTSHATAAWDDLLGYMDGSAAVIGEMMLPVLQPRRPTALEPARALGLAFQLTNFLRDVAEDLDRGRVYLPQEDLERFGADPAARDASPTEWRRADALRDRAQPRALRRRPTAGLALLPGAAGALRAHRARALLRHPRPDRGSRLRRVQPPGPGAHLAQGRHRRPHHRGRPPRRPPTAGAAQRLPPARRAAPAPAGAGRAAPDAAPRPARAQLARRLAAAASAGRSTRRWPRTPAAGTSSAPAATWRDRSIVRTVGGREVTLWRTSTGVVAGPGSCPHLGALLDDCEVLGDQLHCRWHGLALAPTGRARLDAVRRPRRRRAALGAAAHPGRDRPLPAPPHRAAPRPSTPSPP